MTASANVAKGKTGSASSLNHGNVTDALNGAWRGACVQTQRELNPWISVNLEAVYPIVSVRLVTGDCHGNLLWQFTMYLYPHHDDS